MYFSSNRVLKKNCGVLVGGIQGGRHVCVYTECISSYSRVTDLCGSGDTDFDDLPGI